MADKTTIEWTDATWNPVRGCSIVSTGCKNCYAMHVAARFSGPGQPYEGLAERGAHGKPKWTGAVRLIPSALGAPLKWRAPRRVFVNSMSDLFHEGLSNEQIAAVFGVMAAAPQHTFQVLTKRAERMRAWFRWVEHLECDPWTECHAAALARDRDGTVHTRSSEAPGRPWPLPNVWLGVSVEDQANAEARVKPLLETPAAVRFISAEPLLGPVDLTQIIECRFEDMPIPAHVQFDGLRGFCGGAPDGSEDRPGLDWVIIGGESGYGARPFSLGWGAALVAQCKAAGVPVFFKQAGSNPHRQPEYPGGTALIPVVRLLDRKGGDLAELPPVLRVREFPEPHA